MLAGAGVASCKDLAQGIGGDFGIDLGCCHRSMPQKFLHHANVGPALKQVGCEGVAQGMRRNLSPNFRAFSVVFKDEVGPLPGDTPASRIEKEGSASPAVGGERRASAHQVVVDSPGGVGADGYYPLLVAFTEESYDSGQLGVFFRGVSVDDQVIDINRDSFADAGTRGVEEFEQGPIS